MPRRTVKKTKGRVRRSKRRTFRRKLLTKKKRYYRIYHKKKKARSIYKKRQLSPYSQRKVVGIKWSRYLSIVDFLIDDKWDIHHLIATVARQDALNTGIGRGMTVTANFQNAITDWLRKAFGVLSSETMVDKMTQWYMDLKTEYVRWKAYSPTPSQWNLGPMFNQYVNMYKYFKFCGVKVKWIPKYKASLDTPYCYRNVVKEGTTYIVPTPQAAVPQQEGQVNAIRAPETIFTPHAGATEFATSQPQLRLWINFDKQGYEGITIPVHMVNAINNESVWFEQVLPDTIGESRFRLATVLDESGLSKHINSKLVHSYSLSKPFKFYVRPTLQSNALLETIENETAGQNNEDQNTLVRGLIDQQSRTMKLLTKPRKMGWISMMDVYPTGNIQSNCVSDTTYKTWADLVRSLNQELFFDPILFGWNLTCDNISINEQLTFTFIEALSTIAADKWNYMKNFHLETMDYFKSLGRFKVTYYCKFKDLRYKMNYELPNYGDADENALGTLEAPEPPVANDTVRVGPVQPQDLPNN